MFSNPKKKLKMKKIKYLFLAFATVCFIGLYGCKSTPKEEQAAEEIEVVEEVEAVEEIEEVDTTEAVEEVEEVEAIVEEEE